MRLHGSTSGGLGTSALLTMLLFVARTCCEIASEINDVGSAFEPLTEDAARWV